MRVLQFTIQVKFVLAFADQIIKDIDASAPIPAALEGGDGNGPLYLCVLDVNKLDRLRNYAASNFRIMKLYTRPTEFELDDSLYSPTSYVEGNFTGVSRVRAAV
jgi:hypothetical protein